MNAAAGPLEALVERVGWRDREECGRVEGGVGRAAARVAGGVSVSTGSDAGGSGAGLEVDRLGAGGSVSGDCDSGALGLRSVGRGALPAVRRRQNGISRPTLSSRQRSAASAWASSSRRLITRDTESSPTVTP